MDLLVKLRKNKVLEWVIKIVELVCLLLMVLDCNTVLRHAELPGNFFDYYIKYWGVISYGFLLVFLVLSDISVLKEISKLKFLFLLDLVFVIVFYRFNVYVPNLYSERDTEFLLYFLIYINELIMLFRVYAYRGEGLRLMYKLESIVIFLTAASLILWFGACVMNALGTKGDVTVDWGGVYADSNYLNLCFRRYFESDVTKNLGLFVEPPMYGVFLNFGLYTELFLKKKSNPIVIVLFALGLISCRAILAVMIALIAAVFKLWELIDGKWYAKYLVAAGIILGIVAIALLLVYKRDREYGSMATHIDDFVASVKCWLNHNLLFGSQYGWEKPIQVYMSTFRQDNLGLSNSIAVVLAEGGLILFTYYLLPFIVMALQFFKGNKRLAYWGLGMFFVYAVVIIHTRLIVFLFLAFGYSMVDLQLGFDKRRPRVSLRLLAPLDNLPSENEENEKKTSLISVPRSICMVFAVIPVCVAVYSVTVEKNIDFGSAVSFFVVALLTTLMTVGVMRRKKLPGRFFLGFNTLTWVVLLETLEWAVYLLCGHMYRTMNCFLERNGLLLQQSQWGFVRLAVVVYAVAVGFDMLLDDRLGHKALMRVDEY